jgi:hypothetical protein
MSRNNLARLEQTTQAPVCDSSLLQNALETAADDFDSLGDVLSWLSRLFFEIDEQCEKQDGVSATIALSAIKKFAGMGNFIAEHWSMNAGMAEDAAREALGSSGAAHE